MSASRGHDVVLFEANAELGGQIVLAAKATWRRDLIGIARWLSEQMERLDVDVRYSHLADADDILGESPDVVVVATGGSPSVGFFEGSELAASVWDVLAGHLRCSGNVLVVDESGGHAGLSCAEFLAAGGSKVEIITRDRILGAELGETNIGAHMAELYKYGVRVRPDTHLLAVRRSDDGLVALLGNAYGGNPEERVFDHVIGENGTTPNSELYFALKPMSRNLGAVDLRAMAYNEPQTIDTNVDGKFWLYRIGDAWTGRNIHAAMLDAMRICKDL